MGNSSKCYFQRNCFKVLHTNYCTAESKRSMNLILVSKLKVCFLKWSLKSFTQNATCYFFRWSASQNVIVIQLSQKLLSFHAEREFHFQAICCLLGWIFFFLFFHSFFITFIGNFLLFSVQLSSFPHFFHRCSYISVRGMEIRFFVGSFNKVVLSRIVNTETEWLNFSSIWNVTIQVNEPELRYMGIKWVHYYKTKSASA